MAEAMDRSEYPGMLPKLQPVQAVDILSDRVRQVGRLNASIADWLQERSRVEEQYAAGLRKLARKHIEDMDLGVFSVPWGTITSSMETLAESHSSLAAKIEVDVERPLREFAVSNREMQAMTTMQGNLFSMAKDVEKAQQKADKLQGRGEKAETNRVANATSDLDNARVQWDSQAPYVFESLQALDETRLNQLRDLLTQFQTLEVDQVEKNRTAAEQSLNVLLNVEVQDEIKTFAIKAVSGRPSVSRPSRSSFMPTPIPTRGASASNANALSMIPSNTDEDASQISAPTPETSKKSGFGKGLKRLGTVMGRRGGKEKLSSTLPSTAESPERKPKPSPFGRLGRSKESYSLEPAREDTGNSRRPQSPLRLGSEVLEPPASSIGEPSTPSAIPQLDPISQLNGTSSFMNGSHRNDLADLQASPPVQAEVPRAALAADVQRDSDGFQAPPQNLDPISQAQADAAEAERQEPQFNVNIRNAPIDEENDDAALASVATKLQAPPPTTVRRAGTVRGRRDARNSAVISTHGPPGQASEHFSIVPPPTEKMPAMPTNIPGPAEQLPPEASSSSLVQSPSGTLPFFSPVIEPQSPPLPPSSRIAAGTDYTGDNQSVRSGRSTASQGQRHPGLHDPGLSSSIIETISAHFDNAQIVSSSLVGEIALAYNTSDIGSNLGQETIRLENFSALDKVAPNPAFITQSLHKEGEYLVNLANLGKTQVAFKYQLRPEDASSQVPLLLTQACKNEPTQTSIIVAYSLHPGFAVQGRSITLSNVTIALTLEGAKASKCLSKPVGSFAKEKNLIYWQLDDVTLTPGGEPKKLLARFTTDGEAKAGSVEARWEVFSEQASGIGSPLAVSMIGHDGTADPFADEDAGGNSANWKAVPVVRKLASGSYVAKS